MKTLVFCFVAWAVTASATGVEKSYENSFVGTYKGLTEDYEYQFVDDKGKTYLFYELADDVDVDLYEEEYVGKKFKVTWEEFTEEVTDDDGEPTGETIKYLRVTHLEAV